MRIVLTGASGFLGRHLRQELRAAGHEVLGLCRRPELLPGDPGETFAGDVTRREDLDAAFAGAEAVVHSAGFVSHEPRDAGRSYEVHVRGTENALAAAREAGVSRFLHLSSSGTVAVSDRSAILDERAPSPLALIASWPYYRAKLFAEEAALAANAPGFSVSVLNPSLLLGPPADPGAAAAEGAAAAIFDPLLDGSLLLAPPGGVSFVDVRDVARVARVALTQAHPARRYLLAGANWSFAEFYARAARVAGLPAPGPRAPRRGGRLLSWLPSRATEQLPASPLSWEMASHFWWADSGRARAELGFRPSEPLLTLAAALECAQAVRG